MTTDKIIEQRVTELEKRVTALESIPPTDVKLSVSKVKKLSAREFLMTKACKSEIQKTLVLAYYLEYREGIESFNVVDLEKIFFSAREGSPKNINDVVNKNISRGFLMEAEKKKDSKKAWVVTATGGAFVENELKK